MTESIEELVQALAAEPCGGGFHLAAWAADSCIGLREHVRAHPDQYGDPMRTRLQGDWRMCFRCRAVDALAAHDSPRDGCEESPQTVDGISGTAPVTHALPVASPLPERCPDCKRPLQKVRYPGGYLNEDQWDSMRAGDWFCEECPSLPVTKKYRYFWNRDLRPTLLDQIVWAARDAVGEWTLSHEDAVNVAQKALAYANEPHADVMRTINAGLVQQLGWRPSMREINAICTAIWAENAQ
jgi:hypothetical protein